MSWAEVDRTTAADDPLPGRLLLANSPSACHETAPDVADRLTAGSASVDGHVDNGRAMSATNGSGGSQTLFGFQPSSCPTPVTREMVNRRTGEMTTTVEHSYNPHNFHVFPKPCRSKSCPSCGVHAGRKTARAIELAAPTNFFLLTQVGDTYATINGRMRRFSELVRRVDSTYAHVWSAEGNPDVTGTHVHGFFHADAADGPDFLDGLVDARDRANFGLEASFEPVPDGATAPYFAYPFKGLANPSAIEEYLGLNGPPQRRKYVHSSRTGAGSLSFWRDGAGGRSLTQRQAEALASGRYWASRRESTSTDAS